MDEDEPETAVELHDVVTYDLPCPDCGHNLRGLPIDRLCGECACAVDHAIAIHAGRRYWTEHRRMGVIAVSFAIVLLAGLNYLIVGSSTGGSLSLDPIRAAATFKGLWVMSLPIWMFLIVGLALVPRVPMLLWSVTWIGTAAAFGGLAWNSVICG